MRSDTRSVGDSTRMYAVLLGAAALVATLFAPWYAIDLSGAARDALSQQVGQVPGPFGEFARGLLSLRRSDAVAAGAPADWSAAPVVPSAAMMPDRPGSVGPPS